MEINCTSCGARISADDLNLDRTLAKCRICNAVFDFSEQLAQGDVGAGRAPQRRRAPVPMPESLTITDGGARPKPSSYRALGGGPAAAPLAIVRRWFSMKYVPLLFFCVAWDGFLVFWYSIALSGKVEGSGALLMTVFPIAHLAVGVGLTYSTLAGFLNKTRIAIEDGALTVRHGPVPWRGNRTIPAAEVTQLYCEQQITSGKNGSVTSYHLSAIVGGGRKLRLLSGLDSADQALFIEQRFEERLGIIDVAVGGEYAG